MQDEHSDEIARLRELGAKVDELKTTEGWRSWLATASRFHQYSAGNCLLIWSQRPDATRVAGYRAWQLMGRQVRRGEKGIRILAPMLIVDKNSDKGNGEEAVARIRFKATSVFDVSQTDGDPLPPDPNDGVWARVDLPDEVRFEQLCETVRANSEILISIASTGPARGWTTLDPPVVTVVQAAPQSMVRTLLHELGHANDDLLNLATYHLHRGTDEIVAEASAWLVAQRLGVGMDEPSTHYLAGWGADEKLILSVAKRVTTTAKLIGKILLPDPAPAAA